VGCGLLWNSTGSGGRGQPSQVTTLSA
jgi:hypothetical protein